MFDYIGRFYDAVRVILRVRTQGGISLTGCPSNRQQLSSSLLAFRLWRIGLSEDGGNEIHRTIEGLTNHVMDAADKRSQPTTELR